MIGHRCDNCRTLVDPDDIVWLSVEVCRQTHWSPAEWEDRPYCARCAAQPERDEAYERAAARYDGDEKDWR